MTDEPDIVERIARLKLFAAGPETTLEECEDIRWALATIESLRAEIAELRLQFIADVGQAQTALEELAEARAEIGRYLTANEHLQTRAVEAETALTASNAKVARLEEALLDAKTEFETIVDYTYEPVARVVFRKTASSAAEQIKLTLAALDPQPTVEMNDEE